jgi:hypothetical protein
MQRLPWAHLQDTVTRQVIPRLPKEWLLAVAGISTVEVVKREIAAQVSALPLPVRYKTEVLLNQTYTSLELKVLTVFKFIHSSACQDSDSQCENFSNVKSIYSLYNISYFRLQT